MFRKMYNSLSMLVHLELLVQDENVCLKTWYRINEGEYIMSFSNNEAVGSAIERSLFVNNTTDYMELPGNAEGIFHGKLPAGRFGGGVKKRGEDFLPNIPADIRDYHATKLAGTFWVCNSYSWIDPTDPSISTGGEQSDAACWTIGIGYRQIGELWQPDSGTGTDKYKDTIMNYAYPAHNALAVSRNTLAHPLRESRRFGAPASLFLYKPFVDSKFTDCSISFKYNKGYGFSTNVDNWTVGTGYNYLSDMASGLPSFEVVSGGGSIDVDGYDTVNFKMIDADGSTINHASNIYLESTGGYLPKSRISITDGTGSFKVGALGMTSGDTFKIKIGFKSYVGVCDVEYTVS